MGTSRPDPKDGLAPGDRDESGVEPWNHCRQIEFELSDLRDEVPVGARSGSGGSSCCRCSSGCWRTVRLSAHPRSAATARCGHPCAPCHCWTPSTNTQFLPCSALQRGQLRWTQYRRATRSCSCGPSAARLFQTSTRRASPRFSNSPAKAADCKNSSTREHRSNVYASYPRRRERALRTRAAAFFASVSVAASASTASRVRSARLPNYLIARS